MMMRALLEGGWIRERRTEFKLFIAREFHCSRFGTFPECVRMAVKLI